MTTPILDTPTDLEVKPETRKISYKTKLMFVDKDRGYKHIVSTSVPMVTNWGGLQFTMEDRVSVYPLSVIFNWETEQLCEVEPSKLIV